MGRIYDITPFSMLDYPDELSCIVWISGCNLRCVYCHNPDIVLGRGKEKENDELLDFLRARKGKLTAVVFSGGEATFYQGLPELMRRVKELGFKTKLDTNGSNPKMLRELVESGVLDSVALDYKCPPQLNEKVIGTSHFEKAIRESLNFLIEANKAGRIALEIRTTLAPEILSEAEVGWMIKDLDACGYTGTYWLQNITSSGDKTLGNIPPTGLIDASALPQPQNFALGFRNFPEKPQREKAD